jgi:hypothetical protein
MAQPLNKIRGFLFVLLLLPFIVLAQDDTTALTERDYRDYKDADQHEKFAKRRKMVGAWQINQLKKGALVVRLKTNQLAITALRSQGNTQAALKLEAETFAINKNTMFAYIENFTFCKVYFMPSNFSDSLLKGARKGIFLDTNLRVSANIEMTENFYLLAERGYAYNSSLGFVPESDAKSVQEKGNPTKPMAIVLKNKYGHQLKNPLPYLITERTSSGTRVEPILTSTDLGIVFYVYRKDDEEIKLEKKRKNKNSELTTVTLPKNFTYYKLAQYVSNLNDNLRAYYQRTPAPDPARVPEDVKPFLY